MKKIKNYFRYPLGRTGKLHGKKAAALFLLFLSFVCVLFTDLALKQKKESYQTLWENCRKGFFRSGIRCLAEELMPVYDFLDDGSADSGLFAEISEAVMPSQKYLAGKSLGYREKKTALIWKKKDTKEETASVLDFDEMVYEENKQKQEGIAEEQEEESISTEEEEPEAVAEGDGESMEYIAGESYYEDNMSSVLSENEAADQLLKNEALITQLKEEKNAKFLLSNFYIVDGSTKADKKIFNVEKLLKKDMTLKKTKKKEKPQILIYHTHASENFSDSRKGKTEDTVVGLGSLLTEILENTYGYQVYHDTTRYDIVNGSLDRNKAYNQAADGIEKALKKYPSINVIIDLHRDSGNKRITTINGKKTAQMMLFNGISRNKNGDIQYLYNPNLQGNLAFSLQMKLAAMSLYPDFAKPIYIKGYRYNLHYKEKSLLIELGTDKNTVEEARNAMEPLAKVLDQVLSGEG